MSHFDITLDINTFADSKMHRGTEYRKATHVARPCSRLRNSIRYSEIPWR